MQVDVNNETIKSICATVRKESEKVMKNANSKTEGNQKTKKKNQKRFMSESSITQNQKMIEMESQLQNSSFLKQECNQGMHGNKLFKNQSASTLTHSICSYTIPRQDRFYKSSALMPQTSMYDLKSTLNDRGTSLGYGNRGMYGKRWTAEVSSKPASNHYVIQSNFERTKDNQAKTFGLSYKSYARNLPVELRNYRPHDESLSIPGPGTYFELKKEVPMPDFADTKPAYTACKRGKMFNERITEISQGAIYNNKYDLVEPRRYGTGTSFGYGNKVDLTSFGGSGKTNPGPGTYKLPSIFDKFYSK